MAKTSVDVADGGDVEIIGDHTHDVDPSKYDVVLAKNNLKRKAANSNASTSCVVSSVVSEVPVLAAGGLPRIETLKRTVQRCRSKNIAPIPKKISDLVIPDSFKVTLDGDRFLLLDETLENDGRLVVFGTEKNLEILKNCGFWLADGTFSVAPNIFTQLYTIHGLVAGENIPMVYALLTDKSKTTYLRLFSLLRDKVADKDIDATTVDVILTDFEKAAMTAIEEVFNGRIPGSTTVHGCYFHLCQSVHRYVATSRYKKLYETDKVSFLNITVVAFPLLVRLIVRFTRFNIG